MGVRTAALAEGGLADTGVGAGYIVAIGLSVILIAGAGFALVRIKL